MNFAASFRQTPVLLVVVHAYSYQQVERNVSIALNAGADGVFLIAGKMNWETLCDCAQWLRPQFPDAWIGLNLLDLEPKAAFEKMPHGINGLWVDNATTAGRAAVAGGGFGFVASWRARTLRPDALACAAARCDAAAPPRKTRPTACPNPIKIRRPNA